MKILTKEEEDAHYRAVVKDGVIGGVIGLALGTAGVWAASRRWAGFRSLTVPFKVFLVTSSATAFSVIRAEQTSIHFGLSQAPDRTRGHAHRVEQMMEEIDAAKPAWKRARDWAAEHRYGIVGVSWVASMALALGLVRRNPHLTGKQKLVQSRVYAQGLTVAVLLASFLLEGSDVMKGTGRWETVKVLDPNDPEHKRMIEKRIHHERYAGEDQWRDMVEAEERKMKMMEEQKMRESLLGPKKHLEAH